MGILDGPPVNDAVANKKLEKIIELLESIEKKLV